MFVSISRKAQQSPDLVKYCRNAALLAPERILRGADSREVSHEAHWMAIIECNDGKCDDNGIMSIRKRHFFDISRATGNIAGLFHSAGS